MKKMRILSLMLCILLLLSAMPFGVFAKETEIAQVGELGIYEVSTYKELKEIMSTVYYDCSIVLQDDIYQKDGKNNYDLVVPASRSVYLDLNGHSITRETQGNDTALFTIQSDSTLIVYDTSASQTGSCTFSEGYSTYYKAVFYNKGGYLRIDGGYYEILSPYQQGECSVVRTTSGLTEIYGGTFDSSSAWGGDTIAVGHDAHLYKTPLVNIYGGDFYGKYQSIDVTPFSNYLGNGCLFPNVFVMGGNFYICNKGTAEISPSFCYCNNQWGRVFVAEGTVYSKCLNSGDQRFLSGASKKLTSQTIDGFTGGYYEVTAPPMIMPCGEDKYGGFYYERLGLLCAKEVTHSYSYEIIQMHKEEFDSIRNIFDTIYVGETETESPEIKLINRTSDIRYINWYVCDEAEYNGDNTEWTYLGDVDGVVQWKLSDRPVEGKNLLVRCVVTRDNYTSYEDIIRLEYEPLKTAETITSVELTGLTTPADGISPDFDLTPAVDGYYINLIRWTDVTDTKNPRSLKETDTFEAGHKYEFEVWLRTNDGYKFRVDSDEWIDITATIDTREAEVVLPGAENAAIIRMEFSLQMSRVISEVDVVNVDKPYAGEKPDLEAFCITQGCNVTSVKWYDVTDGGYTLLGEDDTFVAGRIYRVNVMVETQGGYTFLMVDRYNEAWGYINGIKAIAGAADEDFWLQLGYVFAPVEKDPSRIISEFDVYDIEEPVAGELPDTDAYSITPGCEVVAVEWYDFTNGTHVPVAENTPFVEGRIYRVVVTVEAGAGYTFLMIDGYNEAEGYIDRTKAMSYGSHDDFQLNVALEFAPCEADPNKPSVKGLLGDADCDTKVNIKDATAIQKHIAGLITLSETGFVLADVDASGNVNIKDATAIQKYIAGIDTGYPIDKPIA